MEDIIKIETRFKQVSKLYDIDLTQENITKDSCENQQVDTVKEKSKEFSQVFTPMYLVDQMVNVIINSLSLKTITCDVTAGYGQFTIRLLRKLYYKLNIDVYMWLKNNHMFTELQAESCAKLVYIFGDQINLYSGDSLKINEATDSEEEKGILFYDSKNKWHKIDIVTELVHTYKDNLEALTFIFKNATKNDELQKLKDGKITFDEEKEDEHEEVNKQIEAKEIVVDKVLNDDKVKDESKSVQEETKEKTPSKKEEVKIVIIKEEEPKKPIFVGTVRLKGSKKPSVKKRIHR